MSRTSTADNVKADMEEAVAALSDGDCRHAQSICNELYASMNGPDSMSVDAPAAASLGIMFMKLAEQCDGDENENIACATQCLRRAMRLSPDSLKAFSASLPLEDERHFVLLRRIGMSIDNPVDLTDRDIAGEEDPAFSTHGD